MTLVDIDPTMTELFVAMMDTAASDLALFLAQLESSAEDSAYVVAASRMAEVLGEQAS